MGNFVNNLLGWYFSKNAFPYWVVLLVDAAIVVAAGVVACCLVQGTLNTLGVFLPLVGTWCCYLIFFLVGFRLMHTYSGVVRYSSFIDLMRIAVANLIGVVLIFAARHIFSGVDSFFVPISAEVLLTCSMLATAAMWSVRIVIKYAYDVFFVNNGAKRVFIYGVKEGGVALAKSVHSQQSKFVVRGFVSDEPNDWSHMLMGCRVYPNDDRLVENMRKQGATVLMVSPLKTDEFRNNQAMISSLSDADVQLMVYRGQSWDGKTELRHEALKDVDIEDLLLRNQIEVDMDAIGAVLSDKCVMITGAAGSIGSEIVRQVATFGPSQMVLVDQAETPLHNIRLMMAHEFPGIPCLTLTASITNQRHMETTFAQYRPEYVFHAAAYKHVPMMEDNPGEAVMNNILGTRIVADLAVKYGARKFVMVSTDKAVNPTNVMGCSKRICEMYCQSLDKKLKEQSTAGQTGNAEIPCSFVTTRFGNVLGSNGSVIPIFQEQIKAGGPLTVTHPDIIRYFMLIPEACRLVLQAGTMGNGGEIFVFDMGKPVRIADLAKRMIKLSGATNVKIKYTGLRDGEKLYEELLNKEENTKPSSHPKIKLADVRELDYTEVSAAIDHLVTVTAEGYNDMDIVRQMKALVPEFKSKHSKYEVLD